jgi:tellurite resistance protein
MKKKENIIEAITEINANFLSLIAWCDGKVDENELARFNEIIDSCPGTALFHKKVKSVIKEMPDKDQCLKRLAKIPSEVSIGILKNAYVIARADKKFHIKEKNLLLEAGIRIGLSPFHEAQFFKMLDHYAKQYQIQREIFMR